MCPKICKSRDQTSSTCNTTPPNEETLFAQILNTSLVSLVKQATLSRFTTIDDDASNQTTTNFEYVLALSTFLVPV